MRFISLASGSKGNSYYIGDGDNGFLVDCGISMRRIVQLLGEVPNALDNLRGIFITHEHQDHVKGLATFLKKYELPVYGSPGTLDALRQSDIVKKNPKAEGLFCPISEETISLHGFTISSCGISHDAAEPTAYRIEKDEVSLGIATDTGKLTDNTLSLLYDANLLVMEANHDPNLLQQGPYPSFLKHRISGDTGHLSNEACAQGLNQLRTARTRHVVLGHLSEENNQPELAFRTVRQGLAKRQNDVASLGLWVAPAQRMLSLDL